MIFPNRHVYIHKYSKLRILSRHSLPSYELVYLCSFLMINLREKKAKGENIGL